LAGIGGLQAGGGPLGHLIRNVPEQARPVSH
jgi:hypothetical protein